MLESTSQAESQLEMSRNVHDLQGIDKLRQAAKSGDENALREAAQQFEALFVQMMLKSMRKAQDAMADEDSPFNSQQVKFYRDMHDQQLAVDLASSGSMGMADLIMQQLSPEKEGFTPASIIRTGANLNELSRSPANKTSDSAATSAPAVNDTAVASKQAAFLTPEDFVETLLPHAQVAAEKLGLSPPALVAQAAVETGWGKYIIHDKEGNNSHNLFGIKADKSWQGPKNAIDTVEFDEGVAKKEKANFRAYNSFTDAINDYVNFVMDNPRYQQAVKSAADPAQYFSSLQKAGYATDPNYADKVMSVFNQVVSKFTSAALNAD